MNVVSFLLEAGLDLRGQRYYEYEYDGVMVLPQHR